MERGLIINVDHPFVSVVTDFAIDAFFYMEKVAFKNPDEFYFKMSNSKLLMEYINKWVNQTILFMVLECGLSLNLRGEPKGMSVQILVRSGQMVLQSEPERISLCAPVTFIDEVYKANAKTQLLKLRTYSALNMSHHEKIVVVDQQICFLEGLDLCFGRYDTIENKVVDHPPFMWLGNDYYNPR
ncbi:phospholipase D zeta 1 [Tanacetum coccineum]